MTVYSEEEQTIKIGNGLYTSELGASIPDGYVPEAYNVIATGETLENRQGFIQTTIDFKPLDKSFPHWRGFYELAQFDISKPVLAIPYGTNIHFIRSSAALSGGGASGDGYMNINLGLSDVRSLCQYNDRTYVATESDGVRAITAYDWSLDSVTTGAVASSPNNLFGLFSFKDRLWGFNGDKLYYTEIADVLNPYPETWSPTTNFEPFRQDRGSGQIMQVVPLGNRLLVFTTAGLFTLLVEGSPLSWIKRTLDVKASVTRQGCAFENQGIVYYVTNTGVYATNGLSTAKISGTIDDKFFQPNNSLRHGLFLMEDGMLLSIAQHFTHSDNFIYINDEAAQFYYTKFDPIAWTQWGSEGTLDYPSSFGDYHLGEVMDIASSVSTFLSQSPITLALVNVGKSTVAAPTNSVMQLVVYDDTKDEYWIHDGTNYQLLDERVALNVVTRFDDAGSLIKQKRAKYAYLEAYTSDANHDIVTKFIIDGKSGWFDEKHITEPSLGDNVNLLKINCRRPFRRIACSIATKLQTAQSQIKLKGITLLVHTHRNEPDAVR